MTALLGAAWALAHSPLVIGLMLMLAGALIMDGGHRRG